jgi:undecaprenyl-diphosphatase
LLPPSARRPAALILAICVLVTAFLGALFAHQTQPSWLDAAIDTRLGHSVFAHWALLRRAFILGSPHPMAVMTAALALACLATRRWRGALLALIAVPAAEVVTEYLLKPLVGRFLHGNLVYPSGHTTGVFVLATVIAVLLTGPLRPPLPKMARLVLVVAAYLIASTTATEMVAMGFHYFTDTVGGAAVATGTVLAAALTIDKVAGLQRQRATAPEIARANG